MEKKKERKGGGGRDQHNKCYVFLMKKGAFLDRYMTVERFIQNDCYFDILTIYCSAGPPPTLKCLKKSFYIRLSNIFP